MNVHSLKLGTCLLFVSATIAFSTSEKSQCANEDDMMKSATAKTNLPQPEDAIAVHKLTASEQHTCSELCRNDVTCFQFVHWITGGKCYLFGADASITDRGCYKDQTGCSSNFQHQAKSCSADYPICSSDDGMRKSATAKTNLPKPVAAIAVHKLTASEQHTCLKLCRNDANCFQFVHWIAGGKCYLFGPDASITDRGCYRDQARCSSNFQHFAKVCSVDYAGYQTAATNESAKEATKESSCGILCEPFDDTAISRTTVIVIFIVAVLLVASGGAALCYSYKKKATPSLPAPAAVCVGAAASLVTLPDNWTTSSGVSIIPEPERCAEIQKLMTDTWKAKCTRDRKRMGHEVNVPTGCRVVNVLRVENHATWDKYWRNREQLRERRDKLVEPFEVLTSAQTLKELDVGINEMYLFHGTSPAAAHKIASDDGFRMHFAGSGAGTMFGPGIYLAENSSKSDEYSKEGEGVYVGLYAMLICRAVAGRVHTVQSGGDHSGVVSSGEYDSVCGDRLAAVGTYREMIFFNETSVYTEYIAIYARTTE